MGHLQIPECCLGADPEFHYPIYDGTGVQRRLVNDNDKDDWIGNSRISRPLPSRLCECYTIGILASMLASMRYYPLVITMKFPSEKIKNKS